MLILGRSFAQGTLNIAYFDSLQTAVMRDSNIVKVKFEQINYRNGKIRTQRLFVKLSNDHTKRFWLIGREYYYHNNGKLASIANSNFKTRILCDSILSYDTSGLLVQKMIILNTSEKPIPVRLRTNFRANFHKYWMYWPCMYEQLNYFNGELIAKGTYIYSEEMGNHVLNGKVIYYTEDGTVIKEEEYNMGNQVK